MSQEVLRSSVKTCVSSLAVQASSACKSSLFHWPGARKLLCGDLPPHPSAVFVSALGHSPQGRLLSGVFVWLVCVCVCVIPVSCQGFSRPGDAAKTFHTHEELDGDGGGERTDTPGAFLSWEGLLTPFCLPGVSAKKSGTLLGLPAGLGAGGVDSGASSHCSLLQLLPALAPPHSSAPHPPSPCLLAGHL